MERGRRTWGRRGGEKREGGKRDVVVACIALAFSLLCTAQCMYDSDGGPFSCHRSFNGCTQQKNGAGMRLGASIYV